MWRWIILQLSWRDIVHALCVGLYELSFRVVELLSVSRGAVCGFRGVVVRFVQHRHLLSAWGWCMFKLLCWSIRTLNGDFKLHKLPWRQLLFIDKFNSRLRSMWRRAVLVAIIKRV